MTLSKNWSEGAPKTILLATDRSARCDRPLDRAVQLAREWEARLIVLHVVERRPDGADADVLASDLKARLIEEMPPGEVPFTAEIRFGAVADTVRAVAAELAADLIVTGVARYNEVGDYVLGTTVDLLVRRSPVPVLVVKGRPRAGYAKLLVATDYSDCAARALQALPAFPKAAATLMHAYHVPFEGFIDRGANEVEFREHDAAESAAFISGLAPALSERLSVVNRYGETCGVLSQAVRSGGFDLAVVGTHGRGGLGRALVGSTAEALLGCLPCDVLIVPAGR